MNRKSNFSGVLKRISSPSMNSKTCQCCTDEYKRGTFHGTSKDEEASAETGCCLLNHHIQKGFRGGHVFFL